MDREKLRDKVKKDIRALLISAPLGVPAHIFAKDYRQMNGKEIPFRELGHRSLDDFILSIPDVVRVGTGPTGLVTFYPIATKETQHIVNMIKKQKKPSIKKAVIPTAIVARKTPMKMSSFSRRGGAGGRFTPRRGGMGGYRPQAAAAKYHPRSYSQPGSLQSLPPRLQRHPHSASYHGPSPSFPPSFRPPSSSGGFTHGTRPPGGLGAPRPAAQRSRLGSVPEATGGSGVLNTGPSHNKGWLSPTVPRQQQQQTSSFSFSGTTAPSSTTNTTAIAPATSNSGGLTRLWREEFRTARHISVEELNSWARNKEREFIKNTVCVEGVTGRQREDMFQDKVVLKMLLRTSNFKRGKMADGPPEAVQLHFIAPYWNLQTRRQPYEVPEGKRLRVYGYAFAAYIRAKEKFEPAMKVLYYETIEGSNSSSGGSSTHSSPRESRSSTPKMEVCSSALEENIFKLLLKFEKGTYAKRLGKVYQSEFKISPPENLLERARHFPFVEMEKINADNEIMHLKEEYRKRGSLRPSQPSSSSSSATQQPTATRPGQSSPSKSLTTTRQSAAGSSQPPALASSKPGQQFSSKQPVTRPSLQSGTRPSQQSVVRPSPPPALPGTAYFSTDDPEKLYEVLVTVVNSPFSFYVQIRDENHNIKFAEMEELMNKHFSKKASKIGTVQVRENELCAALWEDEEEGQWCRALVTSVQDSKVNIVFPDYGNQDCVDISDLRSLPPQFYQVPFQAIHCCLHGVLRGEEMAGAGVDDYFADLASNKICALSVVDCSGARASVEILDTELDDDDTINSKLISRFHPIGSLAPKLPSPGEPMVAAKLADINERGELSIQLVGPGLSKLEELATQIEERYLAGNRGGGGEVEAVVTVGEVYCAEYRLDKAWYRVKVLQEVSPEKVLVEYVDYGNEEEIEKSSLRPKLDTSLFSLPHQAVKCMMANIPRRQWTDNEIDYLVTYINANDLNVEVIDYCVKVMGPLSSAMPVIRLHVKNSEQEMVCINNEMLRDPALFGSSHQSTRTCLSVSSSDQVTDKQMVAKRSHSVSSATVSLPHDGETESDVVFLTQPLSSSAQRSVRESSSTSTSSASAKSVQLSNPQEKSGPPYPAQIQINGEREGQVNTNEERGGKVNSNGERGSLNTIKDDSGDISSVSSLVTSSDAELDEIASESHSQGEYSVKVAAADRERLTMVYSPKVCVREGVREVVSPHMGELATAPSGHLAAPPSAQGSASSSPAPPVSAHLSSSLSPMTPPTSPPLVSTEDDAVGGVANSNKWAELPSGGAVEVEVTWTSSPMNFTLLVLSNKNELDKMTNQLQVLVQVELWPPHEALCPGFICAARYSLDSLWYRAVVKRPIQPDSMQVEVEFLDYGGGELLPLSALKCLPSECRQLPYQAVKASLHGVSEDVSFSPEMVKKFEAMVMGRQLYAVGKGKDSITGRLMVLLIDTSAEHDVVINKELSA